MWLSLISLALKALGLVDDLKEHWRIEDAKTIQRLTDDNARLRSELAGALAELNVAHGDAVERLRSGTF